MKIFHRFRFSMRFTLAATLAVMGGLALLLALTTGEIYRHQALANQRDVQAELAQIAAREQLHELEARARDLGLALQSDPAYRRAVVDNDRTRLTTELRNQFRQHFVTAHVIPLLKLETYNRDLQSLASATAADASTAPEPGCPALIAAARQRTGHARVKIQTALCLSDNQPRFAVLVPVGGLQPTGYLEVVADPVPALANIDKRFGYSVRMRTPSGSRLYASETWPPPDAMHDTLVAEHMLMSGHNEPVLAIALLRDVGPLMEQFHRTRYLVMTLALAATALVVLLALIVLERTTLRPLSALTAQLRRIGHDRNRLDETVQAGGIAEIRELAQEFNKMANELGRLYGSLEHLAFTDPLTNLPNRARFHDSLEESTRRHARKQTPFALLLMDLDRFKSVNDTHGHQAGDLLLQEVSNRLRGVLRESDTITRLVDQPPNGLEEKVVARLGGDEFAAILPGVTSQGTAASIARKLLSAMQLPFNIRGHTISIGMSIGIALYPQHGEDIDALMQRADAAMYSAKNNQTGLAFANTMQQEVLL